MSILSKQCVRCHQTKPMDDFWNCSARKDGKQSYCKVCQTAKRNKWADDNREWCRERGREPSRQNYAKNRERYLAWHRQHYLKNKDRILARNKAWAAANPDKVRVLSLAGTNRRKVRQLQCEGSHTNEEWIALIESCGSLCVCCHEQKPLSKDHIIPLVKGGSDYIENIQPLCRECNSAKRDRVIDFLLDEHPPHVDFV